MGELELVLAHQPLRAFRAVEKKLFLRPCARIVTRIGAPATPPCGQRGTAPRPAAERSAITLLVETQHEGCISGPEPRIVT